MSGDQIGSNYFLERGMNDRTLRNDRNVCKLERERKVEEEEGRRKERGKEGRKGGTEGGREEKSLILVPSCSTVTTGHSFLIRRF